MFDIYSQPIVPPRRRRSVSSSNSAKCNTNKDNSQLRYYIPSHHVSSDFFPNITPIGAVRDNQQVIDPRVKYLDRTQLYYNENPIRKPNQPLVQQTYQNQKSINKSETNLYPHQTYPVSPLTMNVGEERSRSPSPMPPQMCSGIRGRNTIPKRIQMQPNDPFQSSKQNYLLTMEPKGRSLSPMRFPEEQIPPPRPPPPRNYIQDAYYNDNVVDCCGLNYNPIQTGLKQTTSGAQKSLIPIPITPQTESQSLKNRRSASPMPSQNFNPKNTYGYSREPSPMPNTQRSHSPFPSFNNISPQQSMQEQINRKERSSSPEFMSFKNLMQDREIDESKPVSSEFYKQNVTQNNSSIHSPLKSLFSKSQLKQHKTKPNETKQKKNVSINTSFVRTEPNLYPGYNQNVTQSLKRQPQYQSVPLNTTNEINDNDYEPKRFLSPFPSIKDCYETKPTTQETYADHYDQYKSVTTKVLNNNNNSNRLSRDFDTLSTDSDQTTERKSSTLPKKNTSESMSKENIVTSNISTESRTFVSHISVTPTRKISAAQRKASLPEDYIAQNISEVWSREKVASLSHEARVKTQDKTQNINFNNRKFVDWCSRQLFLILVTVLNILLAIIFYYLINMLPNET